MSMESQFEREEDALVAAYNRGEITQDELNHQLNDLRREFRQAAEDAAREAYERELDSWGMY